MRKDVSETKYKDVDIECLCDEFDLSSHDISWHYHDKGEFLKLYYSDDVWLCTDTMVGVFFLYEIMEKGGEEFRGIVTQVGRKYKQQFQFLSKEDYFSVRNRLESLANIELEPKIVDLDSVWVCRP